MPQQNNGRRPFIYGSPFPSELASDLGKEAWGLGRFKARRAFVHLAPPFTAECPADFATIFAGTNT